MKLKENKSTFVYLWNATAACIGSEDLDEQHSECGEDRRPEYVHDVREEVCPGAFGSNPEYLRPSEPLEGASSHLMSTESYFSLAYFVAFFGVH